MSSSFIPYGRQWIEDDDIQAIMKVLKSDFLTQGPSVEELEKSIRDYCEVKYCVAVANGTAGLHLAVAALEIQNGAEGITTPITFAASANCLVYNGLKPIFADIDLLTFNIDAGEAERRISGRTRVIVPVHFAGQPADMCALSVVAKKHSISIIEDAAHAIGSQLEDGSKIGSCRYSEMTVFSFHPVKTITTGEGGAVTTNDERLYRRLLLLRSHGIARGQSLINNCQDPWYYEMQALGYNYRMSDIHAALGTSQMTKLESFKSRRRSIVERYNAAFRDLAFVRTPYERQGVDTCFHLYVLQIDFSRIGKSRKRVVEELKKQGIGTQVHYIPVHLQPFYSNNFGFRKGDYPIAELFYERALSIPLFPKMTDEDVERVIEAIRKMDRNGLH